MALSCSYFPILNPTALGNVVRARILELTILTGHLSWDRSHRSWESKSQRTDPQSAQSNRQHKQVKRQLDYRKQVSAWYDDGAHLKHQGSSKGMETTTERHEEQQRGLYQLGLVKGFWDFQE